MASDKPENLFETHKSLLRDALIKNADRIESTKQVIKKFEVGKDFLKELPLTLKKQILVPVGTKGFLRGNIVHTNEFLHNIGCGYFVKRTSKQAVDVCDRMLSETNTFLNKLYEERQWLNDQVDIPSKENAFNDRDAVEITEQFDEKAEEEWRIKHRESVKRMKRAEAEARKNNTDDQDVFQILDQLELQEELDEAQALVETPRRKEEIIKELEHIETNKTIVQTEEDIFRRLDELEKEEELLDELDRLTTDSEDENVSNSSSLSDEVFLKNFLGPTKSDDNKISNVNNENDDKKDDERRVKEVFVPKENELLSKENAAVEKNESESDISKNLESKSKNNSYKEKKDLEILQRLNDNTSLYSLEKLTTIRFSDEVETKIFDSNQAVYEEVITDVALIDDDEPVTIDVRFSHTDVEVSNSSDVSSQEISKPSDIYYMQYRLKSILKNKNRIFDEPQNTGEYSTEMTHAPLKKKERVKDRSWMCYDTFPKNGNDDQENVQVPPVTEVREKVGPDTSAIPSTSTNQPKKRRSRFSVSRAHNAAIQDSC